MTIALWTVYFNTSDFPGKYVARRFLNDQPTDIVKVAESIESVREWIREDSKGFMQGELVKFVPDWDDDPVIKEIWL